MELCQLPAQGHRPVPQHLQHVRQGGPQLVGRLVEHHGALLAPQLLQPGAALLFVGGQKPLEAESSGGQPRHRQGAHGGAAAGDGLHGDVLLSAQAHQVLSGIADGRGSGVRHQGAALPRQQTLRNGGACGGPVVLVITDQGLADVEVVQQPQGHPGILGGDKIRRPQCFHRPGRQVPQVADRRCHQV